MSRLLADQARAVIHPDRDAFLERVADGPERRAARSRFNRMTQIGLAELRVVSIAEVAPPVPVAKARLVTWDVEATYEYRIRGFDRAPRSFVVALTLRAEPARPEVVTVLSSRPADRPQPWDLEGLKVRRSAVSLVLGPGKHVDLDEVLRRADRASKRVGAVWGPTVPAVWVAPDDTAQAERLLGRSPAQLEGVAAATDGPLSAAAAAGADRIVLNPGAWSSLRPAGRDVVMTHELTHVAVRGSTTRAVPLWLSEGFAEYVAYRFVDLSDRAIASPLVAAARADGLPEHLPGPDDFDPSSGRMSAAYAQAWLAVRELVRVGGESRVVAFYHAAAGGTSAGSAADGPEANTDSALRSVLGLTRTALEHRWLERIRTLVS